MRYVDRSLKGRVERDMNRALDTFDICYIHTLLDTHTNTLCYATYVYVCMFADRTWNRNIWCNWIFHPVNFAFAGIHRTIALQHDNT